MPTLLDVGDGAVEDDDVVLLCKPCKIPESRVALRSSVGSGRGCLDDTDDRCGCALLFDGSYPLFKTVYANPKGAAVGGAQVMPRM